MTEATGQYAGLTPKQSKVVAVLHDFDAAGISPSFRQIKDAMGMKSFSSVAKILNSIKERGYIEREPGAHHGIRLKRDMSGLEQYSTAELQREIAEREARA